ncbi:hypothetical protein T07_7804, partial [Trichinella nelsoni]
LFRMADVPELHLVPNRCGGTSLVHEGRAYKLKRAGRQKYWRCSQDKEGCGGAIWTNLDVTLVIKRNDHIESCPVDEHLAYKMEKKAVLKKRSAEETKPIPAIYDEEASAASAEPSTSGHFPLFKRVKSTMYSHRAKRYPKLPEHRRDLQIPVPFRTTKAGDECLLWQSASRHILRHLGFYELLQLLIDEQRSTETLNHELQQRITALTAEYDGGTRTLEQFLRAVAYRVPEEENY